MRALIASDTIRYIPARNAPNLHHYRSLYSLYSLLPHLNSIELSELFVRAPVHYILIRFVHVKKARNTNTCPTGF